MPTVSWEPTSLNSTYDADEIQFSSGAQLKETADYESLICHLRFNDNVTDYSGESNDGTATDVSYSATDAVVEKKSVYNGTTSKVLLPATMMSATVSEAYCSLWVKVNTTAKQVVYEHGAQGWAFQFQFQRTTTANLVSVIANNGSGGGVNLDFVDDHTYVGRWVHLYVSAKESGNAYFYVNGVQRATSAIGPTMAANANSNYIGANRNGAAPSGGTLFDGEICQFLLGEKQFDTDGTHAASLYNAGPSGYGQGRQVYQYPLSSSVYPTTALAPSENVGYTSYTVTETGGGSTAHRLSPDDGTTNYAYAGGVWGVSDTGNADSTVNTYIDEYTQGYAAITPVVTIASDGYTQHTISEVEIGYTSNNAPTVDAGLDKPLSAHCQITTETAFKPFADCIIVDEDPGVYTVASVDYKIDSGSWVSIPKGSFTTFQDAARALSIAAGTLAVGSYTFSLRATDGGSPALSTTDTLTVTVVSPTSAFWEVQTSSLTTAGSIGKLFTDILDATISSRASQTGLDAVALEATLAQGVTDIRSDISSIDIDTSDLAKELTLTAGISAIQSDIDEIPTDPVLSTDTRLDYLDIAISSRASSASVAALPTTDNTEKIADLHDGLMGSQEIDPAAFTLTLKRTTGATLKIFDLTDQVDEPSWKNVFKKVAR